MYSYYLCLFIAFEHKSLVIWDAKANQTYIKSLFLANYESASICNYLEFFFFSLRLKIKTIVFHIQK